MFPLFPNSRTKTYREDWKRFLGSFKGVLEMDSSNLGNYLLTARNDIETTLSLFMRP